MRILRRTLVVLLTLSATALAGLAASLPIDTWLNRGRVAELTNVVLGPAGRGVRAHLALPPEGDGPWPAIVMVHEFWGLNESLVGKADLLAAEGYLVVAPDTLRGTTTRWLPKALYQSLTTPEERVVADLDAVVDALRARDDVDPDRIVVMGFCYGGGKALAYALAHPSSVAGTAVFYGDLTDDAAALARLDGPVLGVFGNDDDLVTKAEVDAFEAALRAAGVDHRLHRFDGVGHAFVTSADGIARDPVQAAAWGAWLAWLAGVVGEGGGG